MNPTENRQKFIKLLKSTHRPVDKLIKWLDSTDFFIAPASAKYHLNIPGGLVEHSLIVFETFDKLITHFWKGPKIPYDTRIIAALLHDVCKIDNYHSSKEGFDRRDDLPLGHGEKSVIMLQPHFALTAQEIALIRWHMAMYDPAYSRNFVDIKRIYPECKLLYFADDIATQYLEEGGRSTDSEPITKPL